MTYAEHLDNRQAVFLGSLAGEWWQAGWAMGLIGCQLMENWNQGLSAGGSAASLRSCRCLKFYLMSQCKLKPIDLKLTLFNFPQESLYPLTLLLTLMVPLISSPWIGNLRFRWSGLPFCPLPPSLPVSRSTAHRHISPIHLSFIFPGALFIFWPLLVQKLEIQ